MHSCRVRNLHSSDLRGRTSTDVYHEGVYRCRKLPTRSRTHTPGSHVNQVTVLLYSTDSQLKICQFHTARFGQHLLPFSIQCFMYSSLSQHTLLTWISMGIRENTYRLDRVYTFA
jgi:hypothetical protein